MSGTVQTGHGHGAGDPVKLRPAPSPRSEDKRVRILAAAREVFLQYGFQAASMDLVAAAAGVSKVTIYSKFGSKQELFSAIVDDICEQILAMEIILPGAVESSYEGLTEFAVRYALVLFDPYVLALARLAIGENHSEKLLGRLYYQAGPARARAGLADLLRAMSDSGDLAIDDPELAADQFVALLQPRRYYALLDPAASPSIEEIERIARVGVEVFLSHYATRPRHRTGPSVMAISYPAGQSGADLVIRHAAVHPFTRPGQMYRAVAVRDGLILATHDDPHGLDGLVASRTTLLDAPGSAILPAFSDTHNHQLLAARDGELADLDSATTLDELIRAIREQAKRTPPGQWVVMSRSWHESNLREARLPTAVELDAASTEHPILVRRGGHVVIANSMALQEAAIGRGTPDPERGTMVRDPSGQPTGVFIEQPAFQALERLIPALSPDDQVRLLGSQCRRYNAKGLVTIRDPGLTPDEIPIYQRLHDRGGLTTRTRILMWAATFDQARSVLSQIADIHLDNDMLRIDGLKVVVDGGIEGAALSTGYRGNPGYTGHLLVPADELFAIVDYAASRGWRVACHAVGDRTIRTVIDTYASVLERHHQIPPRNLSLEHAILADAGSRQKAAALGIAVTVQHSLLYALAGNMRSYWGDERTASANPVNSWLRAGAHLAAGSDCNVAPYNPLLGIWGLITRGTRSAGVQGPTEAIDTYRAFELYTSAAAWVTGEEAIAGTIQPGSRADLVIFPRDPLLAPVDTLPQLEPVCTLLHGQAVFDPEGLLSSISQGAPEAPR